MRRPARNALIAAGIAVAVAPFIAGADLLANRNPVATVAGHGCGHARWGVKTLSDDQRTDVNFRARTTTIATLHEKDRPDFKIGPNTSRLEVEKQVYRLRNVELIEVKRVTDDGDYHLVVADKRPVDPDDPSVRKMIVELADPDCVEKPFKRRSIARARRQFNESCGVPTTGFRDLTGTATITGVAFLDIKHTIRGAAPNFIELHPVLSFTSANCQRA